MSVLTEIYDAAESIQQKWPEIAGCGYSIQPFLEASEVESLIALHNYSNPVVPTDFYHSSYGSAETRRLIDDGIHSIVKAKLEKLLPGYRLVLSSFVTKKALSTRGKVFLHQDPSGVDHDKNLGLHVWVPLCRVDAQNGCLRMLAYSQRFGHICAIPSNPAPYSELRAELEQNYLTNVPMTAGNACIFDTRVLHATDENLTLHDRIAVQLSLVPVDVSPRLYFWNPDIPYRLEIYNIDREFWMNFKVLQYPGEAEKRFASFVEAIDYCPSAWSMAELAERMPLLKKRISKVSAHQPDPGKTRCASSKRAWLKSFFTFKSQR